MKTERPTRRAGRAESIRVGEILKRLAEAYPDATCALHHRNAFELLVATILSAQCTDARVNMVTPQLFARYPDPQSLASADPAELEEIIKSTGFFRNKTRSLIGAARTLVDQYQGEVPRSMEEMLVLPGVARKTSNVVLGTAYSIPSGVVVDTHVSRVSQRLGLTAETDAVKIESDLTRKVPKDQWIQFSHRVIYHGRLICKAPKPKCQDCFLTDLCVYYRTEVAR